MELQERHGWPRTTTEALALQKELAREVRTDEPLGPWRYVAAADVSYNKYDPRLFAAVIVFDATSFEVVESVGVEAQAQFPYVPGLLSFREAPAVLEAYRRLHTSPDVLICDGQGIAHPRRLGLATHMGLWVQIPTIGSAKSWLCGDYEEPDVERGSRSPLVVDGEVRGSVLRTRRNVKPIYVSPGHLCDIESAVDVILAMSRKYRIPEPIRHAHNYVNALRTAAGAPPSVEP